MATIRFGKRPAPDDIGSIYSKVPRRDGMQSIDTLGMNFIPQHAVNVNNYQFDDLNQKKQDYQPRTVRFILKVHGKQITLGQVPIFNSSDLNVSLERLKAHELALTNFDEKTLDSIFIGKESARYYFNSRTFFNIWSSKTIGIRNINFLEGYTLIDKIGEGGYGQVFHARRKIDNKLVAVKFFQKSPLKERSHPSIKTSHPNLKKVPTEVNALIELEGVPGVVQLHEIYFSSNNDYILVMETSNDFISLKHYLRKRGRLPEEEACYYFKQIVSSLYFMYQKKRHHFDLKGSNILIDLNYRRTTLIDLGGAQRVLGKNFTNWVGTEKNFPPEYYSDQKFYGIPVESWGLGLILLQMTTGHLPVSSNQKENFRRSYEIPSDLSADLRDLIGQCLSRCLRSRPNFKKILESSWIKRLENVPFTICNDYREPILVNYTLLRLEEIAPNFIQ